MNEAYLMKASNGLELKLLECGKEKCVANKNFSFTPKDYHLFHYVVSGKGFFVENNQKHPLKKGHLFYIRPGDKRHYYPDNDDPWTYIWLGFDGTMVEAFLSRTGLDKNFLFYDGEAHVLRDLFNGMYDVYQYAGFLNLECLGYGYQIFSRMMNLYNDDTRLTDQERHLHNAKEFMHNNYHLDISVIDIATNVGISPNYLSNVFNQLAGISTKQYLTKIRMEKAAVLLKSKQFKIKKVGELVGYKNQLHFSGEFKKYYGCSPANYQPKG